LLGVGFNYPPILASNKYENVYCLRYANDPNWWLSIIWYY